jgi:hypothetical protein
MVGIVYVMEVWEETRGSVKVDVGETLTLK